MKFLDIKVGTPDYAPASSPWLHHGPFAMWLVRALRPKCVVELGVHSGYSYFCFCQAVAEGNVPSKCFAVDTWMDDAQTSTNGEKVFANVVAHNARFSDFSTLLRKSFAEARDEIVDGSVDLLHIDGHHFNGNIGQEFEGWMPKLSERAVVLFHEAEVGERNFGVYRYWDEISKGRPSLKFSYEHALDGNGLDGNGLSVLLWGSEVAEGLKSFVQLIKNSAGRQATIDFFAACAKNFLRQGKIDNKHLVLNQLKAHYSVFELERWHDFWEAFDQLDQDRLRALDEISQLKELILEIRSDLFQEFKSKYTHHGLQFLSQSIAKVAPKVSKRFAQSSSKRNPLREPITKSTQELRGPYGNFPYSNVLEEWDLQRKVTIDRVKQLALYLKDGPLISVVVPVYNPDPKLLTEMIESVRAQTYGNWELCIADDASPNPEVKRVLEDFARLDNRIRVVFRKENGHISRATNSAIAIAKGSYIAFLDHDDLLDRDALLCVAKAIDENPNLKIIYTDEDKVNENGDRFAPHFKPDWNRELLYSLNYITHFLVCDAELVRKLGGLRVGFEGAQDYDLLLRCVQNIEELHMYHIPKVLYSWRAIPGSTALSAEAKPYASEVGRRALEEHLTQRLGKPIRVEPGKFPFSYRPLWPIIGNPLVSIIMPTRDYLSVLRVAVDSILEKTTYRNYELIIVDNGSIEKETLEWFAEIQDKDKRVRVLRDDSPFNFSAINNRAIAQSGGEIVAMVNNDIEVITPDWLSEMVALAQRPGIGCVGAKLLFPDSTVQHAGVIIGINRIADHAHKGESNDTFGYFGRLAVRQEYCANTGACLVVRREIFDELGGLNETLTVAFNDIDFCLRVYKAGYRNLWTPWAELYHHESKSRGSDQMPDKIDRFKREIAYMIENWQTNIFSDPYYNINLNRRGVTFTHASPRWTV